MDDTLSGLRQPKFRDGVQMRLEDADAEVSHGTTGCVFSFDPDERGAMSRLLNDVAAGGQDVAELAARAPAIAGKIPSLLQEFDRLRFLVESATATVTVTSGAQLYREVRRIADRVARRYARSTFLHRLTDGTASRAQLLGYALEYHHIVKAAPGLIGPALATARGQRERELLQGFLRSELGHDRFLGTALKAAGITDEALEEHQPLPTTFALCASLGVYARQHPLSFKAALFLFERGQPAFVDAFDDRCRALGLPEAFYLPLREHADLNDQYDHADISRDLMALEAVVAPEAAVVTRRHVALLVETMIQQEEQILAFYAQPRATIARLAESE